MSLVFLTGYVEAKESANTKIAFIADAHLHNIFPSALIVKDELATGSLPITDENSSLLMRSMNAQLKSTRLFNENYFVFIAALDDIASRGIKMVALPGDFTDDGQPVNIEEVERLLSHYSETHGLQFFLITGNHDPVRPFTRAGGKADFLSASGHEYGVFSSNHPACHPDNKAASTVCSDIIIEWGYEEILDSLAGHGFSPKPDYLYYETPFTQLKAAKGNGGALPADDQSDTRAFRLCPEAMKGTARECYTMPDASYLVEPVKGLWLLAIDANVYIPDGVDQFKGSSNTGYNKIFEYKAPLIDWIQSAAQRARKLNKTLIAFSHFPASEFDDGASEDITRLFGNEAFQMIRSPRENTTDALANLGIQIHFAGHMHINDSSVHTSPEGNTLFNIQVPSLAAYQPGYKVLTLSEGMPLVETVLLDEIIGFDSLFPHYQQEWLARNAEGLANWDKAILSATSFGDMLDFHLQGVVLGRHVKEWPQTLLNLLLESDNETFLQVIMCGASQNDLDAIGLDKMEGKALGKLNGRTMLFDLYRMRAADGLARVPEERKRLYEHLYEDFQSIAPCFADAELTEASEQALNTQFKQLLSIMVKSIQSQPSKDFYINTDTMQFVDKP